MVILEAGLLQSQDDCYFNQKTRMNEHKLEANLAKFGERYPLVKALLTDMLLRDPRQRPDWIELERDIMSVSSGECVL